jgi:hypothetical protein
MIARACTILLLACLGCGESNGIYPVYGKVLYKGEPAAGAIVRFVRHGVVVHSGDAFVEGVAQKDGQFTLLSGLRGSGAEPGHYDVLVEWREGPATITKARGRKPDTRPPDRWRGYYADPRRPRFQAEVRAETNYLPPFEITEDPPKQRPR